MSMFLKKTWVGFPLLLTLISAIGPSTVHAQVQLSHPTGGWRASASSGAFMQDVNYPASRVNLREGASVSAQISGHIQQARKPGQAGAPAQLVVNGVPMPLETDESGQFARPYAFGAGSNSVQVRSADGQHSRRVQFIDHVIVHAVVRSPRCLRGVDVEARALAQVITFRIGHVVAARTGVRTHDRDAVLRRVALRAGLGDEVLLVAGQPR